MSRKAYADCRVTLGFGIPAAIVRPPLVTIYDETTSSATFGVSTSLRRQAQTFTATQDSSGVRVSASMFVSTLQTGIYNFELWTTTAGAPTTLVYTAAQDISLLTTTNPLPTRNVVADLPYTLVNGGVYAVVLSYLGANASIAVQTRNTSASTYAGGARYFSASGNAPFTGPIANDASWLIEIGAV